MPLADRQLTRLAGRSLLWISSSDELDGIMWQLAAAAFQHEMEFAGLELATVAMRQFAAGVAKHFLAMAGETQPVGLALALRRFPQTAEAK